MTHQFSPFGLALITVGVAAAATTTVASANGGVYLETGGIVIVEIESAPLIPSWALSTQTPAHTGDGYFRWDGPDLFQSPGAGGLFVVTFDITTPGTYSFNLRNRHEDPNPTEDNDVWVQLDQLPWEKVFSNGVSSVGNWTWESRVDLGGGLAPQASYNLTAGLHTLSFSGRSQGFKIDRFHLALPGHPDAFNVNAPESPRRIGAQYGNANPNSTGALGQIEGRGCLAVVENDVTLIASQLPIGALGYFIVSDTQLFLANPGGSAGNLLVGPSIGRYAGNVLMADGSGRVSMPVNLTQLPRPTGPVAVTAGQTWNFQLWHRDALGGNATSNFTRGLALTFE